MAEGREVSENDVPCGWVVGEDHFWLVGFQRERNIGEKVAVRAAKKKLGQWGWTKEGGGKKERGRKEAWQEGTRIRTRDSQSYFSDKLSSFFLCDPGQLSTFLVLCRPHLWKLSRTSTFESRGFISEVWTFISSHSFCSSFFEGIVFIWWRVCMYVCLRKGRECERKQEGRRGSVGKKNKSSEAKKVKEQTSWQWMRHRGEEGTAKGISGERTGWAQREREGGTTSTNDVCANKA